MKTIPPSRLDRLVLLIFACLSVSGIAAASVGSIYYGQCDEPCWISKIEMDGSESAPYNFIGRLFMDVDYLERKLYYNHGRWDSGQNQAIHSLRRSDLDGSNEELVYDYLFVFATTVEPFGQRVYWSGENRIYRMNFDGTNPEVVVDVGYLVFDMAVDPGAGKLYWLQDPYSGDAEPAEDRILRANLDGTEVESVISVGDHDDSIRDMAIDTLNGHLYWTSLSPHVIRRSGLDGSGIVDLIDESSFPDDPGTPRGIAVAGNSLVIAWGRSIWGADLNGSQIRNISGPLSPSPLGLLTDVPPDATVIPAMSPAGAVTAAVILLVASTAILLRRRRALD